VSAIQRSLFTYLGTDVDEAIEPAERIDISGFDAISLVTDMVGDE